jgi:Flp pilus assembly protein TadD
VHYGDFSRPEIRLFRNQNDLIYERRGAEDVRGSIQRLHGRICDPEESKIDIRCACPLSADELLQRRSLPYQDLAERAGDRQVHLGLGLNHFRDGNYFHAECYLHEFVQAADHHHPDYVLATKLLIDSHRRKNDPHRAVEVVSAALQKLPHEAEFKRYREELLTCL